MRISEHIVRQIIREELIKSNITLNETLLIEGVLQDLTGKVSNAAVIGLMMLSMTSTANAKGFLSHLNNTMIEMEKSKQKKSDLEVKGVGNLQNEEDMLRKKLRANPFGGNNILSEYIRKFEKMGEAGDKIMKEVLKLFKENPELKEEYKLVFKAFQNMSSAQARRRIGL